MNGADLRRDDVATVNIAEKNPSDPLAVVVAALERRAGRTERLTCAELNALAVIVKRRKYFPSGTILAGDGAVTNRARFLLSGWAARQLLLENGRRQIFGFLLPGDMLVPDYYEGLTLGSVVALTDVTMSDSCPVGGAAVVQSLFSMATKVSIQQCEHSLHQQVLRLGAMNALQRTAHLLLEVSNRLAAMGRSDSKIIRFPLTQEALADALGMSNVHVNRTLKQLREHQGILKLSRHSLQIDPVKLAALVRASRPETVRAPSLGIDIGRWQQLGGGP